MKGKNSGITHVGLYTADLKGTIRFYEDAFGAVNLGVFDVPSPGCWLQLGEDDILEIFEIPESGQGFFNHIAIGCEDVDAVYARALACGAKPDTEPQDICLPLNEDVPARMSFVTAPGGERIEIFHIK